MIIFGEPQFIPTGDLEYPFAWFEGSILLLLDLNGNTSDVRKVEYVQYFDNGYFCEVKENVIFPFIVRNGRFVNAENSIHLPHDVGQILYFNDLIVEYKHDNEDSRLLDLDTGEDELRGNITNTFDPCYYMKFEGDKIKIYYKNELRHTLPANYQDYPAFWISKNTLLYHNGSITKAYDMKLRKSVEVRDFDVKVDENDDLLYVEKNKVFLKKKSDLRKRPQKIADVETDISAFHYSNGLLAMRVGGRNFIIL